MDGLVTVYMSLVLGHSNSLVTQNDTFIWNQILRLAAGLLHSAMPYTRLNKTISDPFHDLEQGF